MRTHNIIPKFFPDNVVLRTNVTLVLVTAIALFWSTEKADAFSLGKIRVTGAFEKQFRAEIPVRAQKGRPLTVFLGTAEDYRRLDISRPPFLDHIQIRLAEHPTAPGQKIIYLISSEPIFEPSFNLLLKASQGGGMILENYFLAVDFQKNLGLDVNNHEQNEADRIIARELRAMKEGSIGIAEQPDKVSAPSPAKPAGKDPDRPEVTLAEIRASEESMTGNSGRATDRAPEVTHEPEPIPSPVVKISEPEPAPIVAPREQSSSTVMAANPTRLDGATTYKVRRGNSLYRIAHQFGVRGSDAHKIVLAIWEKNKDLFIKNNMHGLRVGVVLDISGIEEIAQQYSVADAKRAIADQWRTWKNKTPVTSKPIATASADPNHKIRPKPEPTSGTIPHQNQILAALTGWGVDHKKSFDIDKAVIRPTDDDTYQVTVPDTDPSRGSHDLIVSRDGDEFSVQDKKTEQPVLNKKHAYVIHVASFKKQKHAAELVKLLRLKNLTSYHVLTNVPNKGSWYRVVVDRIATSAEARQFARSVQRTVSLRYARILKLPYAIELAGISSVDDAEKVSRQLDAEGYSPYSINEPKVGQRMLLVGAYADETAAAEALDLMQQNGFSGRIVQP